jgi:hypothetical protein
MRRTEAQVLVSAVSLPHNLIKRRLAPSANEPRRPHPSPRRWPPRCRCRTSSRTAARCRSAAACRTRAVCSRMILSDLPTPAEASVNTMGLCQGFAQAGNRFTLFGNMRPAVASTTAARSRSRAAARRCRRCARSPASTGTVGSRSAARSWTRAAAVCRLRTTTRKAAPAWRQGFSDERSAARIPRR